MSGRPVRCIEVSNDDYRYLVRLLKDGRTEQRVARRAHVLLDMAKIQVPVYRS